MTYPRRLTPYTVTILFVLLASLASCSDERSAKDTDASSSSVFGADAGGSSSDAALGADAAPVITGRIYVSMAETNEIWLIDEASRAVLKKFTVGRGPAILLGTRSRSKLYTANWTDNTISSIDLASGASRSIAMAGRPYVIALSPDDRFLYAGVSPTSIEVIDTARDIVVRVLPTAELAASLAVSPDGETLYVAELMRGTLRAVSTTTGDIVEAPIEVGAAPAWITITPDGSKVYTLNYLSDDIGVVDTATFTLTKRIPTGAGSRGIIGNVTPDGTRLYATNYGSGDLIAVDTRSDELVQRIALEGRTVGVQFSQNSQRVYVSDYGVGSLDAEASVNSDFLNTGVFTPRWPGQVSVYEVKSGRRLGERTTVAGGPNGLFIDSSW